MRQRLAALRLQHTVGSVGSMTGLWMLVANAAILVVAALSYFHLFYVAGDVTIRERALMLETALTVLCVVALGLFTTQRLASPWVALRQACESVHGGDLAARLRVAPDGEHVHAAQQSFNAMLESMERRVREAEEQAGSTAIERIA
jgi:nitrogen fixation/metabolism regulation signal transduction histidine kinase